MTDVRMTGVRWTYEDISREFNFKTDNGYGAARNWIARVRRNLAGTDQPLDERVDPIAMSKTFNAAQLIAYRASMPQVEQRAARRAAR